MQYLHYGGRDIVRPQHRRPCGFTVATCFRYHWKNATGAIRGTAGISLLTIEKGAVVPQYRLRYPATLGTQTVCLGTVQDIVNFSTLNSTDS